MSGRVNPLDDIEVINMELVLADLESVEKRLPKIEKMARQKIKLLKWNYVFYLKLKKHWKKVNPYVVSNLMMKIKNGLTKHNC